MSQLFKSIAIIGKYMNSSALQQMQTDLADLARHLAAKNIQVWLEKIPHNMPSSLVLIPQV